MEDRDRTVPTDREVIVPSSKPAADAFISYAREQKPFVERLHHALVERGHGTWVDWEGIPPTSEWLQEIYAAIDSSETFVFVISPESAASPVCAKEIAHAVEHHKRLVPIVRFEVEPDTVAPALRRLNWIFFREKDDFETAVDTLIDGLDTDLEWLHAHTRLLVRAIEWRDRGKSVGLTLRGAPLRQAEDWLTLAADKEPQPTPLQSEFVLASRRASSRRLTWGVVVLSLVLVVVGLLAVLAWYQRGLAETRRAIAESRRLASESRTYLAEQLDLALLLSVAAFETYDTLEARGAMLRALQHSPFLVTYLHRFSGSPYVAFTSDGERLVAVGCAQRADGDRRPCIQSEIRRWNVASRTPVGEAVPIGHTPFKSVLAADDRTLATTDGKAIRFVDVETGKGLGSSIEGLESRPYSLAYSPDGALLAVGDGDGAITVWDSSRRQLVTAPLRGHMSNLPIFDLAFSPDGSLLASASADSDVVLWDTESWRVLRKFSKHAEKVRSVSFHPNGTTLASSGLDGAIMLWDVTGRRSLGAPLTGHEDDVTAVAFAQGGATLVSTGNDRTLRLWRWQDREPMATPLKGHSGMIRTLATNRDGETLASSGADGSVLLWNISHRQPLAEAVTGHEQRVGPVAFSPDGLIVASAACGTPPSMGAWNPKSCTRSEIRLWDARTRRPLQPLIEANARWTRQLSFDPTSAVLASAGCGSYKRGIRPCTEGEILLWDVASGERRGPPLTGHGDTAWSFAFSPEGALGASGSCARANNRGLCEMGEVILWNLDSRASTDTFTTGAKGDVKTLHFGPEPGALTWIDSKTHHGVLALRSGQKTTTPAIVASHLSPIALSADGGLVAHRSGDAVHLWDAAARQPIGQVLAGLRRQIYAVAFSPDGELLAAAGCGYSDRYRGGCVYDALQLWRVADRQRLGPALIAPGEHLGELAFSPDGKTLVSGSRDVDMVFWDLDPESWRVRACRMANRPLSAVEVQRYLGEPDTTAVCKPANQIGR